MNIGIPRERKDLGGVAFDGTRLVTAIIAGRVTAQAGCGK